MSHPEQREFFKILRRRNGHIARGARVLEIGSYDVNGSLRNLFHDVDEYVGIDICAGPGVDLVGFAHEVLDPEARFDIVISAECFEHDSFWRETFLSMINAARPGGLIAFTCAGVGRPEHGTSRSDASLSPGTSSAGSEYYRNLAARDFEEEFRLAEYFSAWTFIEVPTSMDLYFAGIRFTSNMASIPSDLGADHFKSFRSRLHKTSSLVSRALTRALPPEKGYSVNLKWSGVSNRFSDMYYRHRGFSADSD